MSSSLISVQRDWNGNVLEIVMPRPSNFHAHLRDGVLMEAVARQLMWWVKYLLIMPNTGPIDTIEKIREYYDRLMELAHLHGCQPTLVMTLYLTDKLTPEVVRQLKKLPFRVAVKYYPPVPGATTGSGLGIPLAEADETLHTMEEEEIFFLGHLESVFDKNGHELPMEEREGYFMDHEFDWLRERYPNLHINIEHATTRKAIEKVRQDTSGLTTCGVTPQGMLFVNEDLTKRTWGNHLKCMPIAKTPDDRDAVLEFATSGDPRVHLGDDTAPHLSQKKQGSLADAACGCYLPHSLALYAYAFEQVGALDDRFVKFACFNGPDMWGLPRPDTGDRIILRRETECDIPDPTPVPQENDVIIPLGWTIAEDRLRIGIALDA